MPPIPNKSKNDEAAITELRDQLTEHLNTVDDANPDEAATALTETLNNKIEAQEKSLEALKRAEVSLGKASGTGTSLVRAMPQTAGGAAAGRSRQRAADGAARQCKAVCRACQEDQAGRLYLPRAGNRSEALRGRAQAQHPRRAQGALWRGRSHAHRDVTPCHQGGGDPGRHHHKRLADTLVQTVIGSFIKSLMPMSVYPKLAAKGGSFTFGRNGVVSLPARTTSTTVAGAFVAQGAPIPVRQGAFAPISLTPKKMGVITTMTREITEHSTPAIEAILRQAMMEDTAVALDTILLDVNAATTTRPVGLRSVSTTAVTSGGGIAALIGDLKALSNALITLTKGNLRLRSGS